MNEKTEKKIKTKRASKTKSDSTKISMLASIVGKIVMLVVGAIVATAILLLLIFIPNMKSNVKSITRNYMYDVTVSYGKQLESSVTQKGEGVALQYQFLSQLLGKTSIKGAASSYAYVVSPNGTMLYHPTKDKVGSSVENSVVKGLVAQIQNKNIPTPDVVEYDYNGVKKYAAYYVDQDTKFILVLTADESDIMAPITNITRYSILGAILAIILSGAVAVIVALFIVKPIHRVTNYMRRISELDLTPDGTLDSYMRKKDEIGSMSRAMIQLHGRLSDVIANLQALSGQLYAAAEKLENHTKETAVSIEQVEKAVNDISEGASSQADDTQTATENVMLMGNMVQETSVELDELNVNAGNMQEISAEAMHTLQVLDGINKNARESVDVIAQQTMTTNASAMKIREVTAFITSIADETNLLSLNASIEAARAGEQGKSFAVVASQIQKLAEQSEESARKIETIIDELISDSEKAVTTMTEVQQIMDTQSEHVGMTGKIFTQVDNGIGKSLTSIDKISEKADQMDKARINVVDVVQNLTAIAEENAASSEETSASVTEVSNIVLNISANVTQLKNVADELDSNMKQFKI